MHIAVAHNKHLWFFDPLPIQNTTSVCSITVYLFDIVLLREAVNHVDASQETAGWVLRGKSDLNICCVVGRHTHTHTHMTLYCTLLKRDQLMTHNYTHVSRHHTTTHSFGGKTPNNTTSFPLWQHLLPSQSSGMLDCSIDSVGYTSCKICYRKVSYS